jgi:DNA-binding phage protein
MWEKIEKILNEKNISIYRLAKMAGVQRETLYSMKRTGTESPKFDTMVKIADALGVSLDEFK